MFSIGLSHNHFFIADPYRASLDRNQLRPEHQLRCTHTDRVRAAVEQPAQNRMHKMVEEQRRNLTGGSGGHARIGLFERVRGEPAFRPGEQSHGRLQLGPAAKAFTSDNRRSTPSESRISLPTESRSLNRPRIVLSSMLTSMTTPGRGPRASQVKRSGVNPSS